MCGVTLYENSKKNTKLEKSLYIKNKKLTFLSR